VTENEKETIWMSNQTAITNGGAPQADVPSIDDAQDLPARNLAEAHQALAAPFPGACIGYLPNRLGANSQWAAVFPYVDVTAIQDRLDLVVGPDRWSHEVSAIDGVTLGCRLRLYDVAHSEVGQGSDRWSQSANAFKRCARHFGVGRYLTQLPPVRLRLGEGIPVNAKGRPYVTDRLLEILRREYEAQIRAASDRFGAILPHPGVGAGDVEGELPTHPEVETEAQAKEPVASSTATPHKTLLRLLASSGQIDPAELANLIYAAVGESPRPSARAAAALDTLLDRIPEDVAQRTLHEIARTRHDHAARQPASDATRIDPLERTRALERRRAEENRYWGD
jgi:hypothetical protein